MKAVKFWHPWFKHKMYLSTKPYVIKRSREKGEKDLEEIAHTAEVEGCWLFDADNSQWYNSGHSTEIIYDENGKRIGLKVNAYTFDPLKVKQISSYHIHPKIIDHNLRKKYIGNDMAGREGMENCISLFVATPSGDDMYSYSEILKSVPKETIDFRIVSSHGLLIVKFNEVIDPEESKNKYSKITNTQRIAELAFTAKEGPREAIHRGIEHINNEMNNICTMSFQYRDN